MYCLSLANAPSLRSSPVGFSRWYTLLGRGRPRSSEPQRKKEIVTATLRYQPLHLLLKSRVYKRERQEGEVPGGEGVIVNGKEVRILDDGVQVE